MIISGAIPLYGVLLNLRNQYFCRNTVQVFDAVRKEQTGQPTRIVALKFTRMIEEYKYMTHLAVEAESKQHDKKEHRPEGRKW